MNQHTNSTKQGGGVQSTQSSNGGTATASSTTPAEQQSKSSLDALATLAANSVAKESSSSAMLNHNIPGLSLPAVHPTHNSPPASGSSSSTAIPTTAALNATQQLLQQQLSSNPQQWQQLLNSLNQQQSANLMAPNFFAGQQFPFASNIQAQAQLQALLANCMNTPSLFQQPATATAAFNGRTSIPNAAPFVNPTTSTSTAATKTAPQRGLQHSEQVDVSTDDEQTLSSRQEQKRAANRRSAQLSRKRKKLFLEELREENDLLRRKEQILKNIPDLVVVFDSSGKVHFCSESIRSFLNMQVDDIIGSSFWNRLCDDSTRRLKAAFMDSLAERPENADTVRLGNTGQWNVQLLDIDGTTKPVSLHGVVHFAGERPECVCSIRERSESTMATDHRQTHGAKHKQPGEGTKDAVRISDSGQSSTGEDSESGNEIPQTLAEGN